MLNPIRHYFLLLLVCSLPGLKTLCAQTQATPVLPDSGRTQYATYKKQFTTPQKAIYEFEGLGAREMLQIPDIEFIALENTSLTFDVLIAASGTVKYVRAPRCAPELNEYRKGAINALYAARFTPVNGAPDAWARVKVTFPRME